MSFIVTVACLSSCISIGRSSNRERSSRDCRAPPNMSSIQRFTVDGSNNNYSSQSIIIAIASDDSNDTRLQQHQPPVQPPQGIRIEQFVRRVIDFSSQYGSDSSISFTAHNITGKPSKFPGYGDFPETFAMRSYGPWSERAPSHHAEFMPQSVPAHAAQDYITLEFEEYVWPTRISIFESYNPGAVCQVWALNMFQWQLLWQANSGDADALLLPPPQQRSRLFSPPLADAQSPTRCIRLDFQHRHLDYFAELDAVLLVGRRVTDVNALQRQLDQRQLGRIERRLDAVAFQAQPSTDPARVMEHFLCHELGRFSVQSDVEDVSSSFIQHMPHEILLHIAGHLDLVSLCRLARTCRQLRNVAYDPILYTSVNCRPYWSHAPAAIGLLDALQRRCRLIRQLDVSWSCTLASGIQPPDIVRFVLRCGRTLHQLRLNSCPELRAGDLASMVARCCGDQLTELSLRNFRDGHLVQVGQLAGLVGLERLDLYHTGFSTEVLVEVLARNGRLRHLNVGHGGTQTNMDAVAVQLGRTNRRLVSLDMWKSYGLSAGGLAALATCDSLQELDIGWCLRDESALGDSLQTVLGASCGASLRRLGLASIRGLNADDLDAISRRCRSVEQLELMGIRGVSSDKCLEILHQCRRLEMLDVSFCDSIDLGHVTMFRERYPHIEIKWSFVTGDDARD